jgi:hypothetical protein
MAERRVPQVMRKAQSLGQIFIQTECTGEHSAYLCDFDAVG